MKHILIIPNIIVYSLIIFACTTVQIKEGKKDNIIVIVQEKYLKKDISDLVIKSHLLKKRENLNHQTYVDILYLGSKIYDIDYKDIISIITIESEWNPYAYKYNTNDTIDYGLAQINSCHLNENYVVAKKILDERGIKYTNSNYDIKLNILSAFIYLNDMNKAMKRNEVYSYRRWITSYNVGYRGSGAPEYRYSADKYWNRFYAIRSQL